MHRRALVVRGVVQGVGFRPFVYNAARERGLSGWVRNEADLVRIEVQGDPATLDAFVEAIRGHAPPRARVDSVEVDVIAVDTVSEASPFEIRTSQGDAPPRPTIPADLATCPECLAEIRDPAERRHGYPFTNCTNCGPRWSIIRRLPYDRPNTSMAEFGLCKRCRAEYENPADRRFHAQPIACPECGPMLQLFDNAGKELATGAVALEAAVQAILAGRIVALKGLGGFQLLVDATNTEAVAELRKRKRRPDRPFAVMLPSLEDVRRYCDVSDAEAAALASHQSPIMLLRRRADVVDESAPREAASGLSPIPNPSPLSSLLSPLLAPGNPYLGVMLPYTPLHHLLCAAVARPMVCTSGNLSEEPMAIDIDDALKRLGRIADVFLTHDRPIVRPVDDSVARIDSGPLQVLRRARGFAPLPITIRSTTANTPTILAVGGHLKNTVGLLLGDSRQVVMSAHVGDLDSVASIDVFRRAIDDLVAFFDAAPEAVACDLHPDYASSRHAESLAARWNVPLVRVQHHHAHVAACMAEHGLVGPAIGFAWDGVGYGPDGTVWGGETLLCEGGRFRRAATLRAFTLPGGDRAMREPRRSALGVLFEMLGLRAAEHFGAWFKRGELQILLTMIARGVHSPRTSSMGRLFDALAALCGLPTVITFEGHAAMALEFAADPDETAAYPISLSSDNDPIVADWSPMLCEVLAERAAGVPVSKISARFHNALAEMAVAIAGRVAATPDGDCPDLCGRTPHKWDCPLRPPIVLSGGCFQNALLAERARSRLSSAGFEVYTHSQVPPGDGGIALGQIAVALSELEKSP